MRVVPPFDEPEDGHPGLDPRREVFAIKQLAFERGEETLTHRVIVTVAHRTH